MAIRQLPSPRWTVPGASGSVAAGYLVYTYQPGTSTPKPTYTGPDGNTANDNPLELNSRGEANIWWDGEYKVIVTDADDVEVWSQDNYGEGYDSTLTGNFNLAQNGSFEIDTNGDGEPDNWTVTEYTSGTVSRDSTDQYHGQYALKFLSTGGTGNGGGYATSGYFEVQESLVYAVTFAIKSSVVDIHNLVEIVWYTGAKAVISTTAVYDDQTTNPTSWTYKTLEATAPANARYARVRVTGAKDDNATSGTCWFDNVAVTDIDTVYGFRFPNLSGDVTATETELNTMDGITATTAELNKTSYFGSITGNVTASHTELNYADTPNTANKFLKLDGSAQVPFANKAALRGCLASASMSLTSGAAGFAVSGVSSVYDTDSIIGSGLNMTVPSGVSRIRLHGIIEFPSNATGYRKVYYLINSSTFTGASDTTVNAVSGDATTVESVTPVISVSGGDAVVLYGYQNSGTTLGCTATTSMEIIE